MKGRGKERCKENKERRLKKGLKRVRDGYRDEGRKKKQTGGERREGRKREMRNKEVKQRKRRR